LFRRGKKVTVPSTKGGGEGTFLAGSRGMVLTKKMSLAEFRRQMAIVDFAGLIPVDPRGRVSG